MQYRKIDVPASAAEIERRHAINKAAWNEAALYYRQSNAERVANLQQGISSLHPVERRNLAPFGPLGDWCRRAIHLQCASGYDTLSLQLEGAQEVIGVDISDVHIENARWTSDQLEANATWYCCDVLATPAELNATADLVYTGRGALCWLHDLDGWAAVINRLLKPGAIFSVLDDHPLTWLFEPDADQLRVDNIHYFNYAEVNHGWPSTYIADDAERQSPKYERLWPIADCVNALLGAGLQLLKLGEHPESYYEIFPNIPDEQRRKLPLTFSLVMRKASEK